MYHFLIASAQKSADLLQNYNKYLINANCCCFFCFCGLFVTKKKKFLTFNLSKFEYLKNYQYFCSVKKCGCK